MIILTVVYNKPEFIPYQYACLRKYMTVPFEFHVFDNASSQDCERQFREVCQSLGIRYKRVPQDIHRSQDPSSRAGASLTYALQYIYQVLHYRDVVMVNDSDLFLTESFNPIERLGTFDLIGRSAAAQYSLNEPQTGQSLRNITYYTNQFVIMNFQTLPDFVQISFMPGVIHGTQVDCGGLLHTYFEQHPTLRHGTCNDSCSNFYSNQNIDSCADTLRPFFKGEIDITENATTIPDGMNRGKSFAEIIDNVFIHLRAGSNWIQHPGNIAWQRERNLFQFLCHKLIDWKSVIQPSPENKYVISFSLYGNNPKYTLNAIMNVLLARVVYDGWICRFYVDDSVPNSIVNTLHSLGAEIEYMKSSSGSERMLWRFHAASDPTVAAMISRDCDSWVSFREAFSVREWIQSDKQFHIIRDHCYHSQKIMGGMWGVKRGTLPDMKDLCDSFSQTQTYDQGFLADVIYPRILSSVMVHLGNQYTNQGIPANGYFPDGGKPLASYPRIREYIPSVNIEDINTANIFYCSHCKKHHSFFIGEMFNNIPTQVQTLLQTYM